jgi:hypothetical protein
MWDIQAIIVFADGWELRKDEPFTKTFTKKEIEYFEGFKQLFVLEESL